MAQEPSDFTWASPQVDAAQLIAEGRLTQEDVAARVGVSLSTLKRWLRVSEFADRVDSLVDDYRKAVRRRGLAILERRVESVNDRWLRLRRVIEERADDPDMAEVPGGRTGLIVKDYKTVGAGESATVMPIYSVDTALLKEIREHEKQAAQELGQWTEKRTIELPVKAYDADTSPDSL